jgi:hypothetical protein
MGLACTSGRDRGDGGGVGDGGTVNLCESETDSDGDGLWDDFERMTDQDGDGTPNHLDTDSDDDGLGDNVERGAFMGCNAANTDGDALPDHLDNDSDNDGLGDREETERYFTDPLDADSDDDGFDDTAEIATMHDPRDATDRLAEDDFYVVLPYGGEPEMRDLLFGTAIRKADVFFMMDGTGSMTGEVSRLKSSLSTIVMQMAMTISDVGVGFGGFAGFGGPGSGAATCILGICSYPDGPEGDEPFRLDSVITTDPAQMQADVMLLTADYGGANWASSAEAMYLAATGEGFTPWLGPQSCPSIPDEEGRRYGYPCFRPGALPILVVMTDTSSKNGPLTSGSGTYDASGFTMSPRGPHTYDEVLAAVNRIGARVIGIISGAEITSPTPIAQFRTWANETGTVDASGAPIVFEISSDGSGLDTSVVDAIRRLAEETPQDITTRTTDGIDIPERDPGIDATLFIKAITPFEVYDSAGTARPEIVRDDTTFYAVPPGSLVEFTVRFQNDFVEPLFTAQIFLAKIIVVGNGVADLDEHQVVIVVPAGSGPLI